MQKIYRGTEIKFKIELESGGFDMLRDDFDLEVVSGSSRVKLSKDDLYEEDGVYYGYVNTDELQTGQVKVIATAYVTDKGASGGVRQEVSVAQLCNLVNP